MAEQELSRDRHNSGESGRAGGVRRGREGAKHSGGVYVERQVFECRISRGLGVVSGAMRIGNRGSEMRSVSICGQIPDCAAVRMSATASYGCSNGWMGSLGSRFLS